MTAALCVLATLSCADGRAQEKNKLPDPVLKALEKAPQLELYSLADDQKEKGDWHGCKVLGQTTVKGDDAKKVLTALKKGVEDGTSGARCFIPRHGVRVVHDMQTYDLVICFECRWVYVYTGDNDKPLVLVTSEGPQKQLNDLLAAAKVPTAKPEKKDGK
jgi:hypothetical protein